MKKSRPDINICVSHGNSFIKTAIYEASSQKAFFRLESKKPPDAAAYLAALKKVFDPAKAAGRRVTLALCSTQKGVASFYGGICAGAGFDFFEISCGARLPIAVDYDPPQSLGVDRICACSAAWKKYRGDSDDIVVVDFGTATTFNLVSGGRFRGGLILPGFGLYKNSLGESCDYLYRVRYNRIAGLLCRDTESALIAGIYGGYTVLINGLYRKFLADARLEPKTTTLVITGGYANFFTTQFEFPLICDPSLVVDGIDLIANMNGPAAGCRSSSQ